MSDPIEVTASGTSVSVSVGGGIGPQGPAGPQGPPGPVSSVQGLTGAVTLVVTGGTVTTSGSTITLAVSAATVDWASVTGKPATFTPSAHSHAIADVTGLQAALDAKQASGSYAAAVHGHVIADVTGLQAALDGKQAAGNYAAASHGHAATAITYAGGPVGNVTGATVEEALDSIDADLEDRISSSQFAASFSAGLTVTSGVVSVAFGTTSTTACAGNDARLSDSRTPTAHPHGNLTNAGAIGSTSGLIVVTGAGGVLTTAIAIAAGAVSGLAAVATSGSASDLASGTVATARLGTGSATASTFLRGDGTWAAAGSTNASDLTTGTLAFARMANASVTSPSQITASQNDYSGFARGINRFTTNAARDLTGVAAGSDGEVRVLINVGTTAANTLTIKHQSASSTAANRFVVPWSGDCVIPAGGSVAVIYDATDSRWRVLS